MASMLAQPHAVLEYINSGNNLVLSWHSYLRHGHQAQAYINLSTTAVEHAAVPSVGKGIAQVYTYSNANPVITTRTTNTGTLKYVSVQPDSITVVER